MSAVAYQMNFQCNEPFFFYSFRALFEKSNTWSSYYGDGSLNPDRFNVIVW